MIRDCFTGAECACELRRYREKGGGQREVKRKGCLRKNDREEQGEVPKGDRRGTEDMEGSGGCP